MKPYPASYLDRFMDSVKRLPGPHWLTYLVLFILLGSVNLLLSWLDGWLPVLTFSPLAFIFPLWLWFPLAIMTHLNSVSLEALTSFRPLLEVDEEALQRLKYEFTTMPARGVLLSGLVWSIFYLILTFLIYEATYAAFGIGTAFSMVVVLEGLITFIIGGTIYYHSLRQLRLVNQTVKMARQFNLFRLNPVYAFSRVTAQIGISWMIMLSLTLLFYPVELTNLPVLAMLVMQVALAAAAFALPLWFVNRRLVAEKRGLLAENDQRVESTLGQLHRCLDENDLGEVNQLNNVMAGLKAEREVLSGIPTWPWRSGTLTGFVSAIVLPLVLFFIQYVIEKWLGG